MKPLNLVGILLIVGGILGLAYGGFSYTRNTHEAKLGPIEMSLKEKKTVDIPVWASIAAIVAGGVLLVAGSKKG